MSYFFKNEYEPTKIESEICDFDVNDSAIFNIDRAVANCVSLYGIQKLAGEYNRDSTSEGYQKFKENSIVFEGTSCFHNMLGRINTLKGEPKIFLKNVAEMELDVTVNNGSAFDRYMSSKFYRNGV